MDMGAKIKQLREQNNMTLEELGDRVGVGKSTVRKWETGMIANMKRDKIAKIAAALNVSPGYLMGWDEMKIKDDFKLKISSDNLDALLVSAEWAALYMNLKDKPELYDQVINYANYLLKK